MNEQPTTAAQAGELNQAPSAATRLWLERMVAINTISDQSNLGLIETVRDYLRGLGISSDLTYDRTARKANLFATIVGGSAAGNGRSPGIVLSGHTDVVPVAGQDWHSDPFVLTEKSGRLYGRGSADMKGFIAACVAHAEYFANAPLLAPIHFALSYDEEIGCFGAQQLLANLRDKGIAPAACIVGEPTGMQPIVAHKGTHRFECCVRGKEAHSALPNLGVNAIEYAAELVMLIRAMGQDFAQHEVRDYGFPVPYSTVQTTMMNGGTGQNIIPRDCKFLVDVRTLPNQSFEAFYEKIQAHGAEIAQRMKKIDPQTGIDFEFVCSIPAFSIDEQSALVQLAKQLARSRQFERVSFGTEAGLFMRSGIPTVVIGPGGIDEAHRPNESVPLDQLAQCEQFLKRLALPSSFAQLLGAKV